MTLISQSNFRFLVGLALALPGIPCWQVAGGDFTVPGNLVNPTPAGH